MRKTAAFWLFAVRPSSWEAASSYPGYWLCPADCWARLTCLAFELLPVPASQGFVLRSCLISRTDLSPSTSSLFCGPCTTDSSDHHSILLSSSNLLLCPMDHSSPRSYHHGFCSYSGVSEIHLVPTVPSDLLAVWEEMFLLPQ